MGKKGRFLAGSHVESFSSKLAHLTRNSLCGGTILDRLFAFLSDLVNLTFNTDSTMNKLSFDSSGPVFLDFLRAWDKLSLVFFVTLAEGITGVG